MATSSSVQKPIYKRSQVLPSNFHLQEKQYAAFIFVGSEYYVSKWFETKDEAELEQRCMEKQLSYELVETVEGEGFYPERARIMEEKYQASGRTNGLYTCLSIKDGTVSSNITN